MTVQIIHGDCRAALEFMPSASVNCIVTSPPYYGLRDYGTGRWVGGDPTCDHKPSSTPTSRGAASSTLAGGKGNVGHAQEGFRAFCPRCGAQRIDQQIGLEASVAEHMRALVELFRECRRVLRDDGTLWVNYGDAYASSPNGRSAADTKSAGNDDRTFRDKPISTVGGVLKPKDRMLLPARLAIALQEDGWWVRDEIIWHKPNPMPSSIRDRTTPAHEMIYMLSKSPRYYYDQESILVPFADKRQGRDGSKKDSERNRGGRDDGFTKPNGVDPSANGGKNPRSVWTIPPQGFKEAHFATFPPDLIEPCIRAGCPPGGVVLDPFFGAGTTGLVAERNGRNSIGIELNAEYIEIARRRLGLVQHVGVFA